MRVAVRLLLTTYLVAHLVCACFERLLCAHVASGCRPIFLGKLCRILGTNANHSLHEYAFDLALWGGGGLLNHSGLGWRPWVSLPGCVPLDPGLFLSLFCRVLVRAWKTCVVSCACCLILACSAMISGLPSLFS
jgi:hypothetical protein